jgi:hypothetical protein
MPNRLEIRVLGSFEVVADGGPADVGGSKRQATPPDRGPHNSLGGLRPDLGRYAAVLHLPPNTFRNLR